MPEAWSIDSLNVNEAREAPAPFARAEGTGYILGDNQYDSSPLYDAAAARGFRLLAPRKDPKAGISKGHYQSPDRLRAIETLKRPFGESLFIQRGRIEREFAHASSFSGGMAPLPAWVRRTHRVVRWAWAKLIINGVRIVRKQGLTA